MKNDFKNLYDTIEVSNELVNTALDHYNHQKQLTKYKFIICFLCLLCIAGGFVYYKNYIDYTSDFTLLALENNQKKREISSVYTSSKAHLQVIDISQMNEEDIQKLINDLPDEETCWSHSLFSGNDNKTLVFYEQFLYFDIDIKNNQHLKNISIKKKSIDGTLNVSANDKEYSTPSINSIGDSGKTMIVSEINISGDDYNHGKDYNKPFIIGWFPSDYLYQNILANPHYDLSSIQDEITIQITYDNHKTVQKVLLISFEQDGNMSVELKK